MRIPPLSPRNLTLTLLTCGAFLSLLGWGSRSNLARTASNLPAPTILVVGYEPDEIHKVGKVWRDGLGKVLPEVQHQPSGGAIAMVGPGTASE